MNTLLDRFEFSIDAAKMDKLSWAIFIFAWFVVVASAIGSVIAHRNRFTNRQKWFWLVMIVCVPFLGVLAYLPASIMKDGYSLLKSTKKSTSKSESTSKR